MAASVPEMVMDEQRANLFHELVLSNRIAENLMKVVNEVHGEKAAEQVLQNFLKKEEVDKEVIEEATSSLSADDQTLLDQQSKTSVELERLAERFPKNLAKFNQLHLTALSGQSSSIPKNRQSSPAVDVGEQVVEAMEEVAKVIETLAHTSGQRS